jgi:hypothetical protein
MHATILVSSSDRSVHGGERMVNHPDRILWSHNRATDLGDGLLDPLPDSDPSNRHHRAPVRFAQHGEFRVVVGGQ